MIQLSELRARMADMEAEAKRLEATARAVQRERWAELIANPDNWEWRVIPTTWQGFTSEPILVGARVEKRIVPEVLATWLDGGPGTFSSDYETPGRWFGMFYYRTDEGILTHEGGGNLILRDPRLCSDGEWAAILEGNIPAKFLR